ncbi:tetratricopeptide repeat protein [Sphingomonas sp. GV3]|uniref:tetratricopeptide repeat protein n=1 Tax=Sphingomonas sp. GV3 TaxID=3040671 RepID=UPI00280AE53E|nr:tetratricopeptide repeat protein [Sphingomonas sp. GV3]
MNRQSAPFVRLCLALLAASPAACSDSTQKAAALAGQAQQLLDAGQPAEAYALIGKSIRTRDDQPEAFLLQARIAMALNRRDDAYRAYSNALALDAVNPEALNGVAQTGLSSGHLNEAEAAADKILALEPNHVGALLVKGIACMVRNDLDGAIAFSDRILKINPQEVGATILKARALALRGDRPAALALLHERIGQVGETRELTMSLAELQRFGGTPADFLASLERIRQLAPDNRDYRFDLADTLYRTGKKDQARAEAASLAAVPDLSSAEAARLPRLFYAYDPDGLTAAQIEEVSTKASVDTRLALARCWIATGHAEAAIALLKPVATGWSGDIQALYARAIGAAGNAAAARDAAGAILKRDPGNGDALLIRAGDAMARGDASAAIVDYQRVIHDYPQWEEGYLGLVQAYAARDRAGEVRRVFEDGRKALPQSLPLARAYVAALLRMGDGGHALEVARRFALDSPALGAAWALYGSVCARTKDMDCRAEVAEGTRRAQTRYGLDPEPGASPPIALIGRLS